jgi:hypothetical protein
VASACVAQGVVSRFGVYNGDVSKVVAGHDSTRQLMLTMVILVHLMLVMVVLVKLIHDKVMLVKLMLVMIQLGN